MKNTVFKEIIDECFINEIKEKTIGKYLCIMPMGKRGKELALYLKSKNIKTDYFCDNNEEKHGSIYMDIPCISVEKLSSIKDEAFVLIAVASPKDIENINNQLTELDVAVEQAELNSQQVKHYIKQVKKIYANELENENELLKIAKELPLLAQQAKIGDGNDCIYRLNPNSEAANIIQKLGFGDGLYCTDHSIKAISNNLMALFDENTILSDNSYAWYYELIFPDKLINNDNFWQWKPVVSNGKAFVDQLVVPSVSNNKDSRRIIAIGDSRFYCATYINHSESIFGILETLFDNDIIIESHRSYYLYNILEQIKTIHINSDDIIIVAGFLNLFRNIGTDTTSYTTNEMAKAILKELNNYCKEKGAKFIFLDLPLLYDIANLTHIEHLITKRTSIEHFITRRTYLEYPYERLETKNSIKRYCISNDIAYYDLSNSFDKAIRASFFVDTVHFTHEGAIYIANEIYELVKTCFEEDITKKPETVKECSRLREIYTQDVVGKFETPELLEYLDTLKKISADKPKNSGVIVMNCNPFTYGHKYLIETARKQVGHLYILVVEEDLSDFKFEDRFEMIKLGVADIDGVDVINSGKFVISTVTFPEYFSKDALKTQVIDPSMDVEIFCNKIAPSLNVKTRFVGEEPLDNVTNQYNQKMMDILPNYDMELVVIKRKEVSGGVISASRVRKLLSNGDLSQLTELVPRSTIDYLVKLGYGD